MSSEKNMPNLIPLEKFKTIVEEASADGNTWEDFYVRVLEKVYYLGFEEGRKREESED